MSADETQTDIEQPKPKPVFDIDTVDNEQQYVAFKAGLGKLTLGQLGQVTKQVGKRNPLRDKMAEDVAAELERRAGQLSREAGNLKPRPVYESSTKVWLPKGWRQSLMMGTPLVACMLMVVFFARGDIHVSNTATAEASVHVQLIEDFVADEEAMWSVSPEWKKRFRKTVEGE